MNPSSLLRLVDSLSKSEKRFFKLQTRSQQGSKEYLRLFDIMDRCKSPDIQQVKAEYRRRSPRGSWENTCSYLSRMLLDCLVQAKKEKDLFFNLLHEILEIKILQQRSLQEEAFRQMTKLHQKAILSQFHWVEYYCCRYELTHFAENNFSSINDEQLIRKQMKAKDVLRSLNHIHDHYSLYELLKYRLIHSGTVVSEEGKKKMNDLMLSEMVLITGKSKSFTSQKLHLLFQSFFFTDIGDYHSALKSFYQLNELLEKNERFLDNPPLDYLSALIGIIDSLRILHKNEEAAFYLDKLKKLDQANYPGYFRYLVKKVYFAQQMVSLLQLKQHEEAKQFVSSIEEDVFENYSLIHEEKQIELYFYCGLVYFLTGDWKRAHQYLGEITNQIKLPPQLLVSKAVRLLNIIIYHEMGEYLHLEYEIRSYKRYFSSARLMHTEKLIFKIISSSVANQKLRLLDSARNKILQELPEIVGDRYEKQLLRYFDFTEWVRGKTVRT